MASTERMIDLAGLGIVVEHRIDHGGALGRRIGHQIAERVGRLVEERANGGLPDIEPPEIIS